MTTTRLRSPSAALPHRYEHHVQHCHRRRSCRDTAASQRRRRDRARQLMSGARIAPEDVTVTGLIPPGHKVATRAIAAGEPVRRYNQIIGIAKRGDRAAASTCTCITSAWQQFARDYAFGVDAQPTDYVERAGDLHGHRPRRRPRRDAQLHRHADVGELLGDRRARDRRPLPPRHPSRGAGRLSERRRRGRADARRRLRHRHARARGCTSCGARSAAMRGIRTSPRCWSSGSAARRTRSPALLEQREPEDGERLRSFNDPGQRRHERRRSRAASSW